MNILDFFRHIGAELVGGNVKAVHEGEHHVVATMDGDGQTQLTPVGAQIKSQVEGQVEVQAAGTGGDPEQAMAAVNTAATAVGEAVPGVVDAVKGAETVAIDAALPGPLGEIASAAATSLTDAAISEIGNLLKPADTGTADGSTLDPNGGVAAPKGKKK